MAISIDWQFVGDYPHTVTITPKSSTNNYGEDVHGGTPRIAKAYVEPRKILSSTAQVEELVQPTRAFINDITVTYEDLITLPDGSTPDISSIERFDFVDGLDHTIVTFA
jgi:hypothetical protein